MYRPHKSHKNRVPASAGAVSKVFDLRAHDECRRELITALLEVVSRVRRIYPTAESLAACNEVAELLIAARGSAALVDEMQLCLGLVEGRAA
jgi:hypothetical protein